MLQCPVRDCGGFPLGIRDAEVEQLEAEYNADFVRGVVDRVDWEAAVAAARSLGLEGLPSEPDYGDATLQRLHEVLLETRLCAGMLVCPKCAREFRITDGIANLLLAEHEVE